MPPASSGPVPTVPLFLTWLRVGALAFGGGNVALDEIRRALVEKKGWVTDDEFARTWALCQASPGINLLCLTILLGRKLGGAKGAVVSLMGMALPSAAVTLLLATAFVEASGAPAVRAAMRGVVPATVGLGLASIYRAGRPLARAGFRRGGLVRGATVALPMAGLAGILLGLPPVGLLLGGAALGAGAWWWGR